MKKIDPKFLKQQTKTRLYKETEKSNLPPIMHEAYESYFGAKTKRFSLQRVDTQNSGPMNIIDDEEIRKTKIHSINTANSAGFFSER